MSAVLNKTWHYLSQEVLSSAPAGITLPGSLAPDGKVRWTRPNPDSDPDENLPPGLAVFLRALFDCKTKEEETQMVRTHLESVESRLRETLSPPAGQVSNALARALAAQLLGHPVGEWARIYALQLAQRGSPVEKKMGYLACSLLLTPSDEDTLLLMNTLLKDLGSKSVVEVNMALVALAHLTPTEMAPMVVPMLLEKLTNSKDFIRKKSLVCLQCLLRRNPQLSHQLEVPLVSALSDPDPGVVAVAIQAVSTLAETSPDTCKDENIMRALLVVQNQILDGKLPDEYRVRGMSAPWFQIDLIRLLEEVVIKMESLEDSLLDSLHTCLGRTLELAILTQWLGQGIAFQCICLVAQLRKRAKKGLHEHHGAAKAVKFSQSPIVSKCLSVVNTLLHCRHNNAKHTGLSALEVLTRNRSASCNWSQNTSGVLECFDHGDDSIRRKALALLCALACQENVEEVAERLQERLAQVSSDRFESAELIYRVSDLVRRFKGPSLDWRVATLVRLLQVCESAETEEKLSNQLKSLLTSDTAEEAEEVLERDNVGAKLNRMLKKNMSGSETPAIILTLYFWTVGQFYHVERSPASSEQTSPTAVDAAEVACDLLQKLDLPDKTKSIATLAFLDALWTMVPQFERDSPDIESFIESSSALRDCLAVQDAATEMYLVLKNRDAFKCEAFDNDDFTLTHLDGVVVEALKSGRSRPYQPGFLDKLATSMQGSRNSDVLKLNPYQQLDEESLAKIVDSVTVDDDNTTSSVPQVWSVKGRISEEVVPKPSLEVNESSKSKKDLSRKIDLHLNLEDMEFKPTNK